LCIYSNDNFTLIKYLIEQNDFLVVGVLGKQGVGKSTLMSLLAGNKFTDENKTMIFRPGSKIQHHLNQSDKLSAFTPALSGFVTTERTILLDAQVFTFK
jgi:protein SMG9